MMQEEFITRNQLRMEEASLDVECFPPPGYKLKEINRIILKAVGGQQDFTLPLGGLTVDLSDTLIVLWSFARDGRENTYLKWRQKNRDHANAHGKYARSYYAYCRDTYLRMQKLLGEKEFEDFMEIPHELKEIT